MRPNRPMSNVALKFLSVRGQICHRLHHVNHEQIFVWCAVQTTRPRRLLSSRSNKCDFSVADSMLWGAGRFIGIQRHRKGWGSQKNLLPKVFESWSDGQNKNSVDGKKLL